MKNLLFLAALLLTTSWVFSQPIIKEYKIDKQYLSFPVDMQQDRQMVKFVAGKDTFTYSVIRIADEESDYWVFKDVSAWRGEKLKLVFSKQTKKIENIYQADRFAGQDSLYQESNEFPYITRAISMLSWMQMKSTANRCLKSIPAHWSLKWKC